MVAAKVGEKGSPGRGAGIREKIVSVNIFNGPYVNILRHSFNYRCAYLIIFSSSSVFYIQYHTLTFYYHLAEDYEHEHDACLLILVLAPNLFIYHPCTMH